MTPTPNSVPEPSRPASGIIPPIRTDERMPRDMVALVNEASGEFVTARIDVGTEARPAREEREPVAWDIECYNDGEWKAFYHDTFRTREQAERVMEITLKDPICVTKPLRIQGLYRHPLPAPTPIGETGGEKADYEQLAKNCDWAAQQLEDFMWAFAAPDHPITTAKRKEAIALRKAATVLRAALASLQEPAK